MQSWDIIDFNNNRVTESNSEAELWKIANEVNNPKKSNDWSIIIDGKEENNELKIAKAFNHLFLQKISDLKDGIDQSIIVDPLEKLEKKMENNSCKFKCQYYFLYLYHLALNNFSVFWNFEGRLKPWSWFSSVLDNGLVCNCLVFCRTWNIKIFECCKNAKFVFEYCENAKFAVVASDSLWVYMW